MTAYYEIYRTKKAKDFKFRLVNRNGICLAVSDRSYLTKGKAVRAVNAVQKNAPTKIITDA